MKQDCAEECFIETEKKAHVGKKFVEKRPGGAA